MTVLRKIQFFKKISKRIKALGIFNACLYFLKRLFTRIGGDKIIIYKYLIYAQPVPSSIPQKSNSVFSFELLKKYQPVVRQFPRPLEIINFRFKQNGRCIAARKKDEFVGYIWLNKNYYIEDEVRCVYYLHPADKVCWDYDVYVDPKYRFTTAFKRLWDQAFIYQQKNGIKYSVSRIDAFNLRSITVHEKLGALFLGSIVFLIIGGIQVTISCCFKPRFEILTTKNKYTQIHINTNLLHRRNN